MLKKILPESKEYVVILRKTEVQKELYKSFLLYVRDELSDVHFYNPLKAYAICSKVGRIFCLSRFFFKCLEPAIAIFNTNCLDLESPRPFVQGLVQEPGIQPPKEGTGKRRIWNEPSYNEPFRASRLHGEWQHDGQQFYPAGRKAGRISFGLK